MHTKKFVALNFKLGICHKILKNCLSIDIKWSIFETLHGAIHYDNTSVVQVVKPKELTM